MKNWVMTLKELRGEYMREFGERKGKGKMMHYHLKKQK